MPRTKILDLPDKPDLKFEKELWGEGFRVIAGLDEAGRGAWAGPVYAAAVVLPADERICDLLSGVTDSKQMTAKARSRWEGCIKSASIGWAVGSASETEIDEKGIVEATCMAMQRALDQLIYPPSTCWWISLHDCRCPALLPKAIASRQHRGGFSVGQDRAGCFYDHPR